MNQEQRVIPFLLMFDFSFPPLNNIKKDYCNFFYDFFHIIVRYKFTIASYKVRITIYQVRIARWKDWYVLRIASLSHNSEKKVILRKKLELWV